MAWFPIANTVPQYWKQAADGTNEYSGAVLKAYQVGTLTNIPFATDNTGGTTANSIALNANGHPEVSGNVVIPHLDQDYKLALYPDQTSADADSGATWTIDDIDLMGFDSGSLSPEHATDSGTDTYDSAVNTSAPDTGTEIVRDFQSTNSTTTPTLDSITLKDRDGNPLWPGAINGAHRLFYDGTDYLVLDLRASSGVVDPEHATDSATDTYVSATNTTPPADGVKITRDFQSANTTTTPTLDGKTMTTRDGSALWAGAVSGVHELQYDSGADTYLVLEPNPSSQEDPIAYADSLNKGWELVGTVVASNDATLTITGLDSTYDTYAIAFSDLHPATDAVEPHLRVGDSGGIDSGASDYAWLAMGDGIASTSFALVGAMDDADSQMKLARTTVGTAAGEGFGGMIYLHRPGDGTTNPMFSGTTMRMDQSGTPEPNFFGGARLSAITLDRIQFLFSSGNVASGRMTVWGMRHD